MPPLRLSAGLVSRLSAELTALGTAFASGPLSSYAAPLVARSQAVLAAQHAALEGLLVAPELLRSRHPGALPSPGSAAAAAAAAGAMPAALLGLAAGVGALGAPPSVLSRHSSAARRALPAMPPRSSGARTPQLGVGTAPAAAVAAAAAMVAAAPPGARVGRGALSTESEDDEPGVKPIRLPRRYGQTGVPDDDDSDVASIRSASTIGGPRLG